MRPNFYQRRLSPDLGKLPSLLWPLARYSLYALVAYALWGYAKQAWDCRRASKIAEAAVVEFHASGPLAAKNMLKEALSLCPGNPAAARAMARVLDAEGSPQAVPYHLVVIDSGDAMDADRLAMVNSALLHGEEPGALERAVEVAAELDDPALPHLVLAKIHARRAETWEYEEELRRAVSKRPAPDTWKALASALMAKPNRNEAASSEAIDLLRMAAQADRGKGGLEAIELAVEGGLLSPQAAMKWLALHRSHPGADTASRLRAESIALKHWPQSRAEVLERIVALARTLPPQEKVVVARWLMENGASKKVAEAWPLEAALHGREEDFLVWIGAASTTGNWIAVERALGNDSNPLRKSLSQAVQSNAALSGGDEERSATLAREAAAACGADLEEHIEVVRIFLEGGNFPSALAQLDSLLTDPDSTAMVIAKLVPLVSKGRSAADVLAFYEPIIKAAGRQQHLLLSERADRLRLLTGEPVSEDDLQDRLKKDAANPSPRLTIALGHLLQGRASRAGYELALLDSKVVPADLPPSDRVVMAAILAAGGRHAEARALTAGVDRGELCPEEFALIGTLMPGTPD